LSNRSLLPAVMLPLLLTGCVALHRDQVHFDRLSDCPKQTADTLTAAQNELGPLTDTHTVACAVDFLRNSQDPVLRRSALGSRLCLNLAERETDQDKREKLAGEGVAFADAAVSAGGNGDGEVHYYLAANLGLAVRGHLTLAMENLGRLEAEMKKALALSPDIDAGGPMRLLGTLYIKAPAWPNGIGDRDKGLDLLEQAVKKYPGHPLNHLFYAQAIWATDDEGASARAKAQFALGEKLLAQGNWGYSKPSWANEFNDFRDEMGDDAEASVQPPVVDAHK
jgi:hypothetical protein